MHTVLHILEFWALAFVSLSVTLVLLNIFWDLIEQDLCLKTLGKEAAIAGVASFIEAIGLWLILTFANSPMGIRGMIIPSLIVGVIYTVAHLAMSHFRSPRPIFGRTASATTYPFWPSGGLPILTAIPLAPLKPGEQKKGPKP